MTPRSSAAPAGPHGGREAIAEAVLEVLVNGGADALTVRKIATAAGVSVGAVQHHFPTRASLITAAMHTVTMHFRTRLRAALTGAATAEERVRVFCDELAALGDEGRRDAVVWAAFASRAATDPEVRLLHQREWARTEEGLRTLLTEAYPRADISADDAALVLAALDGIAVARGAEGDARMTAERGRRLVRAVLAPLAARGGKL